MSHQVEMPQEQQPLLRSQKPSNLIILEIIYLLFRDGDEDDNAKL